MSQTTIGANTQERFFENILRSLPVSLHVFRYSVEEKRVDILSSITMAINPIMQVLLILYFVIVILALYGGVFIGYIITTVIVYIVIGFALSAYFSACVWSFWSLARDNPSVPFEGLQALITPIGNNGQPQGGLFSGNFDYSAKPGALQIQSDNNLDNGARV